MASNPTAIEMATRHNSKTDARRSSFEAIDTNINKALDMGQDGAAVTLEGEPLLNPETFEELESESGFIDPIEESQVGLKRGEGTRSTRYLILLTTCMAGLQIAWSVEMSGLSPFLLSLGISKSLLALIWIAGPLSGTLVQPYVGIRSDNLRSRWGRRRPFIVGGVVSTGLSYIILSWTREIVGGFLGIFGVSNDSGFTQTSCEIFATIFVYILDFSINVIGASNRAFIVDCVPTHQQEDANAWASRIAGIGNIVGYLAGYVNLPRVFPFLGNTQFKVLCAIAFASMAVTSAISCSSVKERDTRTLGITSKGMGIASFFKSLYISVSNIPPQIRGICIVQMFAWVGWFPFLFYVTTYVGGIYAESYFEENPNMSKAEVDVIMEDGTRVGTYALLVFAITTFLASVFIPLFITPTYKAPTGFSQSGPARRPNSFDRLASKISLKRLQIKHLTLRRAWLMSHILFLVLIWATMFVRSTTTATALVGAVGIPWALTNWAPFALIAAEISKRDAIRRGLRPPKSREERRLAAGEAEVDKGAEQAGVVLGILNVAVSAPQVLATLMSSVIFKYLQKPRGLPGDRSVGWTLRLLSLCAVGAAYVTAKYVYEGDEDDEN